jgi:hypothetical protein
MIMEASKASRWRERYMCCELLVRGARGRIRTDDLPITSRMRYHYATRAGAADGPARCRSVPKRAHAGPGESGPRPVSGGSPGA